MFNILMRGVKILFTVFLSRGQEALWKFDTAFRPLQTRHLGVLC